MIRRLLRRRHRRISGRHRGIDSLLGRRRRLDVVGRRCWIGGG